MTQAGTAGPLEAMMVLDLSSNIAGAYCTKLLADSGADVVKVEPPEGDPARRREARSYGGPAGEPGLQFAYLNSNKRSVTVDLTSNEGRAGLTRLLLRYDAVVESWAPQRARQLGVPWDDLAPDRTGLIWLSITPFGQDGPYSAFQSTDLVLQAASGWMFEGGEPDREPLSTGGEISEYITGTWGAFAVMAAWTHRQASGEGQHIDLAAMEAVQSTAGYWALARSFSGAGSPGRTGQGFPLGIMECADGYAGINVLTPAQWRSFCEFIGRPDLRHDPRFDTAATRREHGEALYEIVAGWARTHTRAEIFRANEAGVPLAMLPTVAEIPRFPQHEARGFFVEQHIGSFGAARQPGQPVRVAPAASSLRRPAPGPGEHNREILAARGDLPVKTTTRRPGRGGVSGAALAGLRVVDLSMWWAGPFCTKLLGDLGAEVIKVESIQVMDGWRSVAAQPNAEHWWESSHWFAGGNRNKVGTTIDLRNPRGVALLKQLVGTADVVVENYTPRVMANFGLAYEQLCDVKPGLIMVSLPSYGLTGPWRDYAGYALPVEQMSGFPELTGYADDGVPRKWGNAAADSIAGLNAAYALLTALEHRRKTGEGQHLDVSQLEVLTCFLGESFLECEVNGRLPRPLGNAHPLHAPHGVYRCSGDDEWVTIAVIGDHQWQSFCQAIGRADWRADSRLGTAGGRANWRTMLDEGTSAWTARRDRFEVMRTLQAAGIAAMPVMSSAELLEDPHLRARGYWRESVRPEIGRHHHGLLWAHFSRTPIVLKRPAPTLGEHNDAVFGEFLGLSTQQLQELGEQQVIGTRPLSKPRV